MNDPEAKDQVPHDTDPDYTVSDYTEANRAMWNATADVHASVSLPGLLAEVARPDFSTFDFVEEHVFGEIGLSGKDVAQLSCNNGRELISCKKAGAARCVGFDISEKFIAQGRELAQVGGVEVDFVRTDVYDIPHGYDSSFDIVYVTIGALGWLRDLNAYYAVVARLLRPGGYFFLYEMHPILDMFEAATGLEVKHSYFRTEPYVEEAAPDYLDKSTVVESTSYWFHHKLSEVIGGALSAGLALRLFEEYAHDQSEVFAAFEYFEKKPPLSYALLAQKAV
jgi:SAM-dependent methyltransferase